MAPRPAEPRRGPPSLRHAAQWTRSRACSAGALSMLLHCAGQSALARHPKGRYPLTAYADDTLILRDDGSDAAEMVTEATAWRSTADRRSARTGTGAQRGQDASFWEPGLEEGTSIASRARAKATESLGLAVDAPVTHHARLTRPGSAPQWPAAPLAETDPPRDPMDPSRGSRDLGMLARTEADELLGAPKSSGDRGPPQAAARRLTP
ncbi:Reverse transcriptase/endonuclease, putative [Giardia lamblia P15]|uniref:Reverse transcriptase/endonuclease, putative n=1 Tax=Giardia intestinalis (strain P15) TaxID=658858 RepID=E1F9J6_GIAIA|nr:Reverse transcriptase/endonuclease, putative [Giardia lamblia P15]